MPFKAQIERMAKRLEGDPKKAIAYLRLSPKPKKGTRMNKPELGLEAQRMEVEAWAKANGVEILAFCVDEDISGADDIEDRPGLVEALALLSSSKSGILLVNRHDRIARDVLNSCLIERMVRNSGARIHSVDGAGNGDSPTDEFTRHILNAVGQLERRLISARTKAALAVKKAEGVKLGRRPISETVPQETLEFILKLYLSGNFSHESLAFELNRRGIPTASKKGQWRKNTVQRALKAAIAA